MFKYQPGLVHMPVTPFGADHRIDYELFGKFLEFHIKYGADALAPATHVGESVSLTDVEKRELLEFTLGAVRGRVPVIAHVSEAGTGIAVALARHAEAAGAAAVVATTPYYWTPPPAMILEHFVQIGSAVHIPFLVKNAPDEMAGSKVTAELMLHLIGQIDNFAGLADSSLDWQFMIELIDDARRVRPDFQLVCGTDLMVSPAAIGATGVMSSLAMIAPRLIRRLYDLCRADKLFEARSDQEAVAALRQTLKKSDVAHLKAALRHQGRDCGGPRPPLRALDSADALASRLAEFVPLRDEPRGWN
jgi:4-hydroxy-tetrahydrodipicolinate synthase